MDLPFFARNDQAHANETSPAAKNRRRTADPTRRGVGRCVAGSRLPRALERLVFALVARGIVPAAVADVGLAARDRTRDLEPQTEGVLVRAFRILQVGAVEEVETVRARCVGGSELQARCVALRAVV